MLAHSPAALLSHLTPSRPVHSRLHLRSEHSQSFTFSPMIKNGSLSGVRPYSPRDGVIKDWPSRKKGYTVTRPDF